MQANQASKEVFVTLPMQWVSELLDRVPELCSVCGQARPSAEITVGHDGVGVCNRCASTQRK
jgi:hypothetical protein